MNNIIARHGDEAERAILGCVLMYGKSAWLQVAEFTEPEEFSSMNRVIYDAIAALDVDGEPIDYISVCQHIERDGKMDECGGRMYLNKLQSNDLCLPSGIAGMLAPLHEASVERSVRSLQASLGADLDSGASSPAESLERHTTAVLALSRNVHNSQRTAFSAEEVMGEVMGEYAGMVEMRKAGKAYSGLDCGFPDLNSMLNGLRMEEMTVLGARPSIGKTSIALQLAAAVAFTGKHVGVWSCEMSRKQLGGRLLQMLSGVDAERFRKGALTPDEEEDVSQWLTTIAELPLTIYETPGLTVGRFAAQAEQLRAKHDVGLLLVDHLHRMDGPGNGIYEVQSRISRGLRDYSLPTGSPHLLVLAQLSRKPEDRPDRRPQMADLRDAGGIEQDAVNTLLLHRPGHYAELRKAWEKRGENIEILISYAELICAKTRFGPTGEVKLRWEPTIARFASAAPSYITEEYLP